MINSKISYLLAKLHQASNIENMFAKQRREAVVQGDLPLLAQLEDNREQQLKEIVDMVEANMPDDKSLANPNPFLKKLP